MSYTTPPAWVSGGTVTAANLNVLSDDITDLDARAKQNSFTGVSLSRSSNQSTSNATETAISWSSAALDVGGWWSSGTDVVVPSGAIPAGYTTIYVELIGQSHAASNGAGLRYLFFKVNGTIVEQSDVVSAITGDTTSVFHIVWAQVAAADVITLGVKQSSGGALNFADSVFKVRRLGPAT